MLTRVLLHQVEPPLPNNPSVDPFDVYDAVHEVKDLTLAFQNINDRNVVQDSPITALTPGSGIEAGLIQDEPRFTVHFHAANHCGFEFGPIGVIKVQSFRHGLPFCRVRSIGEFGLSVKDGLIRGS